MLCILPPVTPGGFNPSIDWRMVSSSATQDIAAMSEGRSIQLTSAKSDCAFDREIDYGRTTKCLASRGRGAFRSFLSI